MQGLILCVEFDKNVTGLPLVMHAGVAVKTEGFHCIALYVLANHKTKSIDREHAYVGDSTSGL